MRCKVGDLAYFKGPKPSFYKDAGLVGGPTNNGKIVRCVRLAFLTAAVKGATHLRLTNVWEITPPLNATDGTLTPWCADDWLIPIRDPGEDATDEMVALLGKPASQPLKEHA